MSAATTVFVVDPDALTRNAVRDMAHTMNLKCEAYPSAQPFLDAYTPSRPGCLVLEIRIPDVNGLDILDHLAAEGSPLPVILLTSQATVSMAVRAMRAGALHVLEKPLREHELWDALHEAVAIEQQRRSALAERRELDERLAKLSSNEGQILGMIAQGISKKRIASEMGVSVRTIEHRRVQLMDKLGLNTSLDLLRFAVLAFDGDGCSGPNTWHGRRDSNQAQQVRLGNI